MPDCLNPPNGLLKSRIIEEFTATTPVRTEFGWHLILVTDRRLAAPPKFEEVVEQIRGELGRDLVDQFYQGITDGAKIEKFNIDGTIAKF